MIFYPPKYLTLTLDPIKYILPLKYFELTLYLLKVTKFWEIKYQLNWVKCQFKTFLFFFLISINFCYSCKLLNFSPYQSYTWSSINFCYNSKSLNSSMPMTNGASTFDFPVFARLSKVSFLEESHAAYTLLNSSFVKCLILVYVKKVVR